MQASVPSTHAITLMIVDDDQDIRNLFQQSMEKQGFQVLAAADGEEAMQYVASHAIHLTVVDMTMPQMSGLELAVEFAHLAPQMPVIIATGHTAESVSGLPANVVEVIQKPYRNRVLLERIREILQLDDPTTEPSSE